MVVLGIWLGGCREWRIGSLGVVEGFGMEVRARFQIFIN